VVRPPLTINSNRRAADALSQVKVDGGGAVLRRPPLLVDANTAGGDAGRSSLGNALRTPAWRVRRSGQWGWTSYMLTADERAAGRQL
jgi:hypothetical protein